MVEFQVYRDARECGLECKLPNRTLGDVEATRSFERLRSEITAHRSRLSLGWDRPLWLRCWNFKANFWQFAIKLPNQELGDRAVRSLVEALVVGSVHVEEIELYHCRLGDASAQALACLLEQAPKPGVRSLKLSHNYFTPIGVGLMLEAAAGSNRYPINGAPLWLRVHHQQVPWPMLTDRPELDQIKVVEKRLQEKENVWLRKMMDSCRIPAGLQPKPKLICLPAMDHELLSDPLLIDEGRKPCNGTHCAHGTRFGPIVHLPYFWMQEGDVNPDRLPEAASVHKKEPKWRDWAPKGLPKKIKTDLPAFSTSAAPCRLAAPADLRPSSMRAQNGTASHPSTPLRTATALMQQTPRALPLQAAGQVPTGGALLPVSKEKKEKKSKEEKKEKKAKKEKTEKKEKKEKKERKEQKEQGMAAPVPVESAVSETTEERQAKRLRETKVEQQEDETLKELGHLVDTVARSDAPTKGNLESKAEAGSAEASMERKVKKLRGTKAELDTSAPPLESTLSQTEVKESKVKKLLEAKAEKEEKEDVPKKIHATKTEAATSFIEVKREKERGATLTRPKHEKATSVHEIKKEKKHERTLTPPLHDAATSSHRHEIKKEKKREKKQEQKTYSLQEAAMSILQIKKDMEREVSYSPRESKPAQAAAMLPSNVVKHEQLRWPSSSSQAGTREEPETAGENFNAAEEASEAESDDSWLDELDAQNPEVPTSTFDGPLRESTSAVPMDLGASSDEEVQKGGKEQVAKQTEKDDNEVENGDVEEEVIELEEAESSGSD